MTDDPLPKGLWTPRSVEDTLQMYADWADDYEADVAAYGYATPGRVAMALAMQRVDRAAPVLDFGCGTGLSGAALSASGFCTIDGVDISAEMIAQAGSKGVYRKLSRIAPGELPDLSPYAAITATGVISLGAAPSDLLADLLAGMSKGALLAFSYNDATLLDETYQTALIRAQLDGHAVLLSAAYGPHLPQKEGARGSTVYVLRRL